MAEKSEKMTKQELRAPDAFQLYGAEASDWLMKRQQYIGAAVVVLIVGGLVASVVHYFSSRSEEKASKALGQALLVLERPVVEISAELKSAVPDQELPFKSAAEKDQKIFDELNQFRTTYKGSDAAATAALPLGKAAYRMGKYDEALAAFGDFIKSADKKDPLLASAREGQGYAYEAQTKLDDALGAFREMDKVESGEFMQGMGKYHQARILVEQGKKDEAAQLLADLQAGQANTAAGRLATERLAVLAADGVKIPESKVAPPATPGVPAAPAGAPVGAPAADGK